MRYELVLFDLDGTLVDTLEAINKTTNSAMEELGLRKYSLEESRNLIGNGVQGIVEKVFKMEKYDEGEVSKERMSEVIRKYYKKYFNYNVNLYEGIEKLLNFLEKNNVKKGIITNKDHNLALETVKENLLKWEFVEILGANDNEYPRKPNPYNVNKISEKLGIEKSKILFVGDMIVDYETAKNAGVDIVYCNWGFGATKGEENIPKSVKVNNVEEIIEKFV